MVRNAYVVDIVSYNIENDQINNNIPKRSRGMFIKEMAIVSLETKIVMHFLVRAPSWLQYENPRFICAVDLWSDYVFGLNWRDGYMHYKDAMIQTRKMLQYASRVYVHDAQQANILNEMLHGEGLDEEEYTLLRRIPIRKLEDYNCAHALYLRSKEYLFSNRDCCPIMKQVDPIICPHHYINMLYESHRGLTGYTCALENAFTYKKWLFSTAYRLRFPDIILPKKWDIKCNNSLDNGKAIYNIPPNPLLLHHTNSNNTIVAAAVAAADADKPEDYDDRPISSSSSSSLPTSNTSNHDDDDDEDATIDRENVVEEKEEDEDSEIDRRLYSCSCDMEIDDVVDDDDDDGEILHRSESMYRNLQTLKIE